jgi:hypothetical protein
LIAVDPARPQAQQFQQFQQQRRVGAPGMAPPGMAWPPQAWHGAPAGAGQAYHPPMVFQAPFPGAAPAAAAGGAPVQMRMNMLGMLPRPRRIHTITLRINMRTMLQILVFVIVFWQVRRPFEAGVGGGGECGATPRPHTGRTRAFTLGPRQQALQPALRSAVGLPAPPRPPLASTGAPRQPPPLPLPARPSLQHFTMRRLVFLALALVVVFVGSLLPPVHRLLAFARSLTTPRPPPRAAPALAPAEPGGGQPAAAAAAAAAAAPARQQRPGILREVAVVVVGFLSSLLPTFNYNPDDAAAFAVAQDMAAREQQQQQQAPQQQQAVAAGGEGDHQHHD